MSKQLSILAIFALGLSACMSSGSASAAPKLKNVPNQTLSVFDTLVVEFDQDLESFDNSNYESSNRLQSIWSKDHPSVVKFVGLQTYVGNKTWALLPADSTVKLKFLKLKSSGGGVADTVDFQFQTSLMADGDFSTSGRNSVDIPSSDSLMSGARFLSGSLKGQSYGMQVYSGVLSGLNEFGGGRDEVDYYRIQLALSDTLQLDLLPWGAVSSKSKCKDDFLVELVGPKKWGVADGPGVMVSRDTAKLNSSCHYVLKQSIDASRQIPALDQASNEGVATPKDYWIRVIYKSSAVQNFTPYRLELGRLQKK